MGLKKNNHIHWHHATITRRHREARNGHKSVCLWFTGLSGSGKSSIAHVVEERLHQMGCRTFVLDGDNVRHGLCSDLGFSDEDRAENIRRIGEVTKLFVDAGIIVMTAFISPFRSDRLWVRRLLGDHDFIEKVRNLSSLTGRGILQRTNVLASAGLHVLKHNIPQLAHIHSLTTHLAKGIHPYYPTEHHTNMVFVDVGSSGLLALPTFLQSRNILIQPDSTLRLVLHPQISIQDIDEIIAAFRDFSSLQEKSL